MSTSTCRHVVLSRGNTCVCAVQHGARVSSYLWRLHFRHDFHPARVRKVQPWKHTIEGRNAHAWHQSNTKEKNRTSYQVSRRTGWVCKQASKRTVHALSLREHDFALDHLMLSQETCKFRDVHLLHVCEDCFAKKLHLSWQHNPGRSVRERGHKGVVHTECTTLFTKALWE